MYETKGWFKPRGELYCNRLTAPFRLPQLMRYFELVSPFLLLHQALIKTEKEKDKRMAEEVM